MDSRSDSIPLSNAKIHTATIRTPSIVYPPSDNIINMHTIPAEFSNLLPEPSTGTTPANETPVKKRDNWDNSIEFLMSCIALSVGLGNVWRFPFAALENGGGAFLVPYLIVLFLVGKPIYYMEMLLGQFSSRGIVKVFDFSPIMRGVGYAQVMALGILATYYAAVMATTLRYFFDSFKPELPWSTCREEWNDTCIASSLKDKNVAVQANASNKVLMSSTALYFNKIVLNEKDTIADGIGAPSWNLAIMLAISWIIVTLIIIKGVKSSGKASYVLAIFPYIIMFILLIRALTLPGAKDGVIYFLKPQWNRLLDAKVWYNAVTQVFFSLAVCFGVIIMYSSYNRFGHNVYRDANIITTLDTFTSLLSGIIIFGILGNLAYETKAKSIAEVVQSGPGLAFISYPDAIAKLKFLPQIFSVLFFLMLFTLGVGSNVGMVSCIMTVLKEQFVNVKRWLIVIIIAVIGYLVGLAYITPGGQFILTLLDYHGVTIVSLVSAIFELVAVAWVYGCKRLCRDAEFMLGIKTSIYYRICWSIITPALMTAILIYDLVNFQRLQYKNLDFSIGYTIFGWSITAIVIGQLIYWALYAICKQPKGSLVMRISNAVKPYTDWGPLDSKKLVDYQAHMRSLDEQEIQFGRSFLSNIYDNIFG